MSLVISVLNMGARDSTLTKDEVRHLTTTAVWKLCAFGLEKTKQMYMFE